MSDRDPYDEELETVSPARGAKRKTGLDAMTADDAGDEVDVDRVCRLEANLIFAAPVPSAPMVQVPVRV